MVNLPCLKGSCPNFLRPTCSYTECQLSFLTGSCPTERISASYSSCLYLILLPSLFHKVLIFSGRFTSFHSVGLGADAVLAALHRYRVSFQNPARFQNYLQPSRGLELSCNLAAILMPPMSPVYSGFFLCPLTSSSDHMPPPSSRLYK